MNADNTNIITSNGAFIVYYKEIGNKLYVFSQLSASRNPNRWELTGGGLDYGIHETLLDTVIDESKQEIGIRPLKEDCRLIGVLQQLCKSDKVPGKVIVGMVLVYTCPAFFEISDLIFQFNEVADAKWWPIEEAILANDVMLLASRRMLAIFYNNLKDTTKIHTGDLSKSIIVDLPTNSGIYMNYSI